MPNTVKELLLESRVGHVVGIFNTFDLQRTFHVEVAKNPVYSRGYRPEFVMQRKDLVGKSAVPAGSPYPEQSGFIAMTYRVVRIINELNFVVRVNYAPDALTTNPIDITDLWEKEIDYGLEMEEVFFDLDGKPIGRPLYLVATAAELADPNIKKFYSDLSWRKRAILVRVPGFVSAAQQQSMGDDYVVSQAEKDIAVTRKSFPRPKRVATLRLIRAFDVLDNNKRMVVFNSVGLLNDAIFVGAEKGTLRFNGLTSRDPRTGFDPDRRSAFDKARLDRQVETITLSFSWNVLGWQPAPYTHIWKDTKGNAAPIFDENPQGGGNRERQESQYRDYWYGDLYALLELFD